MSKGVVFLDKDGTLVEDVPYNADPAFTRLLPGAGEAVRSLHASGWRVAVVTNQSGVARGLFPESALVDVEARLRQLLNEFGVPLAGFFYCPHYPNGIIARYSFSCECRKPAPGLILAASQHLGVDPRDCWMIGNSPSDVEAGQQAGCRTILVGQGSDTLPTIIQRHHAVTSDLKDACWHLLHAPGESLFAAADRTPEPLP